MADLSDPAGARLQYTTRLPTVLAAITCSTNPVWTAERTNHVWLLVAWLVHAVSIFLCAALVFVFVVWVGLMWSGESLLTSVVQGLQDVYASYERDPGEATLVVLAVVGTIELGFVVAALLGMAWGARDEPMVDSFTSSLRRTWLQTPHLLVVVLVIGGWAAIWEGLRLVVTSKAGSYSEWPWWVRNIDVVFMFAYCVCIPWFVVGWLRALTADRPVRSVAYGPICEACGYSLVGADPSGRCPECGQSVADSLNGEKRQGATWQQRRSIGYWRAWRLTTRDAVRLPGRFGGTLCMVEPNADHRSYFAVNLMLAWAVGALWFLAMEVTDSITSDFGHRINLVRTMLGGQVAALFSAAVFVVLVCGAAVLAALGLRLGNRRNLLPISMQMAAYASTFAVACLAFSGGMGALGVALYNENVLDGIARTTGMRTNAQMFLIWLVPTLGMVLYWMVMVGRGTAAARYVNQ